MSRDVVRPFLEPLDGAEIQAILDRYPGAGRLESVLSVSERPYSAASLVRTGRVEFFIKKRPTTWRRTSDVAREHALVRHLTDRGFPTPALMENKDGATLTTAGEWYFEVFARARGEDRYRTHHTWMPFEKEAHARSAGRALASFHRAVQDFPIRDPRPVTPMSAQFELARHPDLAGAVEELAGVLPALGRFLQAKPWQDDLVHVYEPFYEQVRAHLPAVPGWTTHGDWHANNLFFDGDEVVDVIDFHLSDFCTRPYDLAVALDRNCILRLSSPEKQETAVRYDLMDALLTGYESEFPLSPAEKALLPALFPIHQLDLALTNIAYYEGVEGDRGRADWAYEVYLLKHTRWFQSACGRRLLEYLRERIHP